MGLPDAGLTTPKGAALAGIVSSILLLGSFWLIRSAIPADPTETGGWLAPGSRTVSVALSVVPFAGVAFLWFIGVVRAHLGNLEDRFFSTVFLGSGLLFLCMLFVSAGMAAAILTSFSTSSTTLTGSVEYQLVRSTVFSLINVYMMKMAAVFIICISTVAFTTGFVPRWLAILGCLADLGLNHEVLWLGALPCFRSISLSALLSSSRTRREA